MVSTGQESQAVALRSGDRKLLIGLTIWVLLQVSRLVAITLIASIVAGEDAPAWMYPAILDVFCAVTAPLLVIALWKWRGLAVWTLAVLYLTVSIVDHIGFFVTFAQIGAPVAFEGLGPSSGVEVFPAIQALIDAIFLFLVVRSREMFFKPSQPAN